MTTTTIAHSAVRVCSCGNRYFTPNFCEPCLKKARVKAATERVKAATEKKAKIKNVKDDLKYKFLFDYLPKEAKVSIKGRQVVIAHEGVSVTFYTVNPSRH